ncbi:MAG: hypothetical protein AAF961_13930, partial [Planctomycetota bacterium]
MNLTDRLGARLVANGCHFRVWAPQADDAQVLLQRGPRWSQRRATAQTPLQRDGGYWVGVAEGAEEGDLYRFLLRRGGH